MDDEARAQRLSSRTGREVYESLSRCLGGGVGCAQASAATLLAARLMLLESVEDDDRAYRDAIDAANQWKADSHSHLASIRKALDAWAGQHDAIYASLEQCGGVRSLRPGCGNWTSPNLKSAVDSCLRGGHRDRPRKLQTSTA